MAHHLVDLVELARMVQGYPCGYPLLRLAYLMLSLSTTCGISWKFGHRTTSFRKYSSDTRREGKERIQWCFKKRYPFLSIWTPTIHHSPGSNSHIPVPFPCLSWTFSFVDEAVPKNKFDLKSSVHTADASILYIIYLKQMCAWLRVWCLLSLNRIHVNRHVPSSYTITYYVYIHQRKFSWETSDIRTRSHR